MGIEIGVRGESVVVREDGIGRWIIELVIEKIEEDSVVIEVIIVDVEEIILIEEIVETDIGIIDIG